jgi:methylmalonyl-CoA mutase N-terminal domain/subunit
LHTNSLDEALALPTESSARLALRTQQVIAYESNVNQVVDPLGGSWFIESLTQEIEERTMAYLAEIDQRGGTIRCIESGYIQNEISNSAYLDQKRIDQGDLKVVGVNCFQASKEEEKATVQEILRISPELEKNSIERVRAYRAKRNEAATRDALRALKDGAKAGSNMQELIITAVKAGATLGEISDSMREVFGLFQEYAGF